MVTTIYSDNENELQVHHDEKNVTIEIRPKDWYENPSQCISIDLNCYDVYQLIEELEIYADACNDKIKDSKK
jgi:hypothetical protein